MNELQAKLLRRRSLNGEIPADIGTSSILPPMPAAALDSALTGPPPIVEETNSTSKNALGICPKFQAPAFGTSKTKLLCKVCFKTEPDHHLTEEDLNSRLVEIQRVEQEASEMSLRQNDTLKEVAEREKKKKEAKLARQSITPTIASLAAATVAAAARQRECSEIGCDKQAIGGHSLCTFHLQDLERRRNQARERVILAPGQGMLHLTQSSRRCAVTDCNNFAFHEGKYCLSHRFEDDYKDYIATCDAVDAVVPEGSVELFPVATNLYVDVCLRGDEATGRPSVWMGTIQSSLHMSFIQFLQAEHHESCVFDCRPFCVLNDVQVTEGDLKNGSYSYHPNAPAAGSKLDNVLPLDDFSISVKGQVVTPDFVDVGANSVELKFVYKDADVVDSPFKGIYTSKTGNSKNVSSKTNHLGRILMCFPREGGVLQGEVIVMASHCDMAMSAAATVTATATTTPTHIAVTHTDAPREVLFGSSSEATRKVKVVNTIVESRIIASLSARHDNRRPVVVLGDVSGSMRTGSRMECLRTTFLSLYFSAVATSTPIALVAWDSWTTYCPHRLSTQATCEAKYLTIADKDDVESWITSLYSRGGNNMRYAIEDAVRKFPDVGDIHVLCDGDVRPFVTEAGDEIDADSYEPCPVSSSKEAEGEISWSSFRSRYPHIYFHFVAFSNGADCAAMEQMSSIGNGDFTVANR